MNANANTSSTTPTITAYTVLSTLSPRELGNLYRHIRQALVLNNSEVVTDNRNHLGVRLTVAEKTCIRTLAKLHRRTVSDELRRAIRGHLREHERVIAELGVSGDGADDN